MGTLTIDCEEVKQYRDRFLNGSVTRIICPRADSKLSHLRNGEGIVYVLRDDTIIFQDLQLFHSHCYYRGNCDGR